MGGALFFFSATLCETAKDTGSENLVPLKASKFFAAPYCQLTVSAIRILTSDASNHSNHLPKTTAMASANNNSQNVTVAVRIRPLLPKEIAQAQQSSTTGANNHGSSSAIPSFLENINKTTSVKRVVKALDDKVIVFGEVHLLPNNNIW